MKRRPALRTIVACALVLGGCAAPGPEQPAEVSDTLARPAAPAPVEAKPQPPRAAKLPASGGGLVIRMVDPDKVPPNRRRPMEVKPMTTRTDCRFHDGSGYGGRLALDVADSAVRRLDATIEVPKHGRCTLALDDFEQTRQTPSIELKARNGGCFVRIWEQEAKATVAVSECRRFCTGGAHEYVWPIFIDMNNGRCG